MNGTGDGRANPEVTPEPREEQFRNIRPREAKDITELGQLHSLQLVSIAKRRRIYGRFNQSK